MNKDYQKEVNMFSLIKYELKKLLSNKFLLILIVILIIANLYFVGKNISNQYIETKNGISNFVNDYISDIDNVKKYIKDYITEYDNANKIKVQNPEAQVVFPESKYLSNDYNFFKKDINNYIDYTSNYETKIKNAIRIAQGHKYEYEEISKNENNVDFSFEIAYQDQIINKYSDIKDIKFPIVNIKGYDLLLFYNGVGVFSIIAMVLGGIIILIPEYQTGAISVIKVSKNGRSKTITAKIIVALIYCLMFCILINLSSYLFVYVRVGFDGGSAPIQMVQDTIVNNGRSYIFCPFKVSVITGLLLKTFLNAISSLVVVLVTLCIASLFKSYILTFVFSFSYLGFNYILGNYNFLNDYNYFKNVNLFWTINGIEPIIYYRGINVFNTCIPTFSTILITYSIILLISLTLTILFYTKTHLNLKRIRFSRIIRFINVKTEKKLPKTKTVFTYELKKVYSKFGIVIILIVLLSNIALSIYAYTKKPSNDEIIYSKYMQDLEGEWTIEKSEYINKEYYDLNNTITIYSIMLEKYKNKELTVEEITDYLKKYYTALVSIDVVKGLYVKNMELEKIVSNGGRTFFVNEYNWGLVYKNNFSYIYLLAIILLISNIFSIEYREGKINVLKTTKNYFKTIKSKMLITISSAVLILCICEFIQYLFIMISKGLTCGNASAHSITDLLKYGDISLNSLFILMFLKQLLVIILFSMFVFLISKLTKRLINTLLITSIVAFAPTLFTYFGFDFMNNISLITLLGRS